MVDKVFIKFFFFFFFWRKNTKFKHIFFARSISWQSCTINIAEKEFMMQIFLLDPFSSLLPFLFPLIFFFFLGDWLIHNFVELHKGQCGCVLSFNWNLFVFPFSFFSRLTYWQYCWIAKNPILMSSVNTWLYDFENNLKLLLFM